MGLYRLQNDHYFHEKRIADTDVDNDVTCTRQSVNIRVVYDFYDPTLSTE